MATSDMRNLRDPLAPTADTPLEERREEEVRSAEVIAGGSIAEAVCGVGCIVLAILGLAGLLPLYLTAIATIALGAALVLEGAAILSRFTKLIHEVVGRERVTEEELGGGMTIELFGGIAGIVLGILGLLGVTPLTLLGIAAIVFGGSLLLSSGATARLNNLVIEGWHGLHERARHMAREAVRGAAGLQVLAGLAAAVLGILAILNIHPLTLTLVALLCAGGAVLLSGAAISTKMMTWLRG